jgi:hypothetical protein
MHAELQVVLPDWASTRTRNGVKRRRCDIMRLVGRCIVNEIVILTEIFKEAEESNQYKKATEDTFILPLLSITLSTSDSQP